MGSGVSSRRIKLTYANVMATIAVVAVVGGGALATGALVGSDGKINSCVDKRTGEVRIVKAGKRCERGERALKWNQRGRAGPQGAPGQAGQPGQPGQPGSGADTFSAIVSPSATNDSDAAGRAAATPVPLATVGPVSLYGKCWKGNGGGDPNFPFVTGEILVGITAGNEAVFSSDEDSSGQQQYLTSTRSEEDRAIRRSSMQINASIDPGGASPTDGETGGFYVVGNGFEVHGSTMASAKLGTPDGGNGPYGAGERCMFSGFTSG